MFGKNTRKHQLKSVNKLNPIGLKLDFSLNNNTARTEFTLSNDHQNRQGYVHEGIIAMLMDEGMGWISRHRAGASSVTAKLEINYQLPAKIGEPLVMITQITRNTKRLLEESSRIERKDGTIIATGTCIQYVMSLNPDVK